MDLINRKQAIKEIRREVSEQESNAIQGEDLDVGVIVGLKMAVQIIKDQLSVEKTGRWAWPSAGQMGRWLESRESSLRPFMCSNCGCIYDVDTSMGKPIWNYCPNCGARMVPDEDKH